MLVAVALMEAGYDAELAVEHIRKARRGAINTRQLNFLYEYKAMRGKKNGGCCVLMWNSNVRFDIFLFFLIFFGKVLCERKKREKGKRKKKKSKKI